MVRAKSNETARMHFTVFDTDGVTPLTGQAGSCTDILNYNGAASGQAVTVAEIGSTGRYIASFTPNAVGDWDLEVTCPDDRVVGESFEVEAVDLDDLDGKVDIIDGNVDDILIDTNEIQGKLPTNDIADQTLIDGDLTSIEGKVDALNDLSSADIQTVIEDNDLDHVAAVAGSGNPAKNTYLDLIMSSSGVIDSYDRASMSLQTIAAYLVSGGGSFTTIINHLTDIKGPGWVDENLTVIDAIVDAIKTKTDNLPADPASETNVDANETKIDAMQLNVTDILADTNEIQGKLPVNDIADQTLIDADLTNIETKVDSLQTDLTEALARLLRILSLTNENVVFEHSFDANNDHTGWTVWCYDSKTNADTHDKNTGLLETYTLSVTYDGDENPTITKIVRNP